MRCVDSSSMKERSRASPSRITCFGGARIRGKLLPRSAAACGRQALARGGRPQLARSYPGPVAWLTPEELIRIPSEQLGILILHRLTQVGENNRGLHNFTVHYL